MKRTFPVLLFGALLLCSGCASTMGGTQDSSQEWRLQSLEKSFLDFQEAQRMEAERARKADEQLAARLDRLEQRVTAILGDGEDLPPEQGLAQPEPAGKPDGASAGSPFAMQEQGGDAASQQGGESMGESMPAPIQAGPESGEEKPWADVPGPALEASTRAPAAASAMSAGTGQSQYNKGLNLVRSGRSVEGRDVLQGFLKANPGSKLAPNAMYWIGESWYGQKNYPQAILAFKDVVTKYPKHHKAQAALLKIGMSYRNVGDKDNAVFYLRTLVDDHPGSEPAKMAQQLLREIPN